MRQELGDRPEVREVIHHRVARPRGLATEPPVARGVDYLPSQPLGAGVDVLVYTPEEAGGLAAPHRDEVREGGSFPSGAEPPLAARGRGGIRIDTC